MRSSNAGNWSGCGSGAPSASRPRRLMLYLPGGGAEAGPVVPGSRPYRGNRNCLSTSPLGTGAGTVPDVMPGGLHDLWLPCGATVQGLAWGCGCPSLLAHPWPLEQRPMEHPGALYRSTSACLVGPRRGSTR
jgi:hypothetical protein